MALNSAGSPSDRTNRSWSWEPEISWLTDELSVSGCFPIEYVPQLAETHAIRAVIDLREEDRDDEQALAEAGIAFLHLPAPDLHAASPDMLDRGVAFAREHIDRGERVLIHCQHGIGRSPLLALCVMVDLGMEPLAALEQAKSRRMSVSPSEAQYRGWAEWLKRHGHPVPDYHSFGCIAYRHLAQG
jgi:protein-tyrosine phosphatase